MYTPRVGTALLVIAAVLAAILPGTPGLLVGYLVGVLGVGVFIVALRHRVRPGLVLVVLFSSVLVCASSPIAVRDTTLRLVGDEVTCPVRTAEYLPNRGSARGGGSVTRWTVDCPAGPVTFDAAPSAFDRYTTRQIEMLVGSVTPRPVALLLPWWIAVFPVLGAAGLAVATWRARPVQPARRRST